MSAHFRFYVQGGNKEWFYVRNEAKDNNIFVFNASWLDKYVGVRLIVYAM